MAYVFYTGVSGNSLNTIIKHIIIISLNFWTSAIFASPQMPDYIIFGKDTISTYNLLLEQYLQNHDTTKREQLFGLTFRNGSTLNCWRGYQAIYKIENDSLYLTGIIDCFELSNGKINEKESLEKIKSIFGDRLKNNKVHIDWFDGFINYPLTNEILRWDGVFYKIFEKERVISISNGIVVKVEDVDNYIDDPKKIDRRDKSKISDLLFKKLKKAKWKNSNDYDCSEKYLVTIDENGLTSKVRMLLSEEEIEKYYEADEFEFCVNKVLMTLKELKFDIIKDKGIPISEDVYIEIWVESNGNLQNWTY
ncbi:MAG: hypothetical protein RLO81_11520 [Fulvivirga sp.]|uniref:hypothetical protein n=1 Tax=Fulvivirga sp. TaxID=1931237 RepID=UPI0032EA9710